MLTAERNSNLTQDLRNFLAVFLYGSSCDFGPYGSALSDNVPVSGWRAWLSRAMHDGT